MKNRNRSRRRNNRLPKPSPRELYVATYESNYLPSMSHTAQVDLQEPSDGESGTFPCRWCRRDTSQSVLTIVNVTDSDESGDVQFWNHFLTVRCNGCGTVNFCVVTKCSEEMDYDHRGTPFLAVHKTCYPPAIEDESTSDQFVSAQRISELAGIPRGPFDTVKLRRLVEELNAAYAEESYISCIFLVRAILDHVPPIFGETNFSGVANNCSGSGKSFRNAMLHLENTSRKIADAHLHSQIRASEILPTSNQIEFRADLDVLLSEVVRLLRGTF